MTTFPTHVKPIGLGELGIRDWDEAREFLGERSQEWMRIQLCLRVADNPEINLWNWPASCL